MADPPFEADPHLFSELAQALIDAPYRAVGPREVSRVLNEIVLDSFAPISVGLLDLGFSGRILDLGCGPGIPSLPLALVMKQAQFTGIDSTAKKIRFAESLAARFGAANVDYRPVRAEELHGLKFDLVLARGFAALPVTMQHARAFLGRKGRLLVYTTPAAVPELPPRSKMHAYRRPVGDREYGILECFT